jgi:glycosyltransferase involved in cell wall biosynthesis
MRTDRAAAACPAPSLSIVIPVFNRPREVARALSSVQKQTRSDFEVIVVDDASTDDTASVVAEFARHDSRIRLAANQRRKGAQGARNTGVLLARATLVSFLDSDDEYAPAFVERMLARAANTGRVVTCFSARKHRDGSTSPLLSHLNEGNIHSAILSGQSYIDTNSCVFPRTMLLEIGLLDEQCPGHQEWDLHIRVSARAGYQTVPEVLTFWHQHELQHSASDIRNATGYCFILRKHRRSIRRIAGVAAWRAHVDRAWTLARGGLRSDRHLLWSLLSLRPALGLRLASGALRRARRQVGGRARRQLPEDQS